MRACARAILVFFAALIFCVAGYHNLVSAQADEVELGAPVVLQGEPLFRIKTSVGSFSPTFRANISRRQGMLHS